MSFAGKSRVGGGRRNHAPPVGVQGKEEKASGASGGQAEQIVVTETVRMADEPLEWWEVYQLESHRQSLEAEAIYQKALEEIKSGLRKERDEGPFVFEDSSEISEQLKEEFVKFNREVLKPGRKFNGKGPFRPDCRLQHDSSSVCQFCDWRRGTWATPSGAYPSESFLEYQKSLLAPIDLNKEPEKGEESTILAITARDPEAYTENLDHLFVSQVYQTPRPGMGRGVFGKK